MIPLLLRIDVTTLLSPAQFFITSFGVAFLSGFLPLVNIEAYLVSAVVMGGAASWVSLVIACTLGQMAAKCLIYFSGRGLLKLPYPRHGGKREKIEAWLRRREGQAGGVLFVSALVGFPPFYLLSLLAGSLRIPFAVFLAAGVPGRFIRFALFAWFPQVMMRLAQ